MDFSLSEEEQAVLDLGRQILGDCCTHDRLRELEAQNSWHDTDAWAALGAAGLLGIGLSSDVGGAGLDLVAVAQLFEAQGQHVAPIPLWATQVAALAIDHWADDALRASLLPTVAAGDRILCFAVQEPLNDQLHQPDATVEDADIGPTLTGTKTVVESINLASHVLVSATTGAGPGLFLASTDAVGITLTEGRSTRAQPVWQVEFEQTPVVPVGGAGTGSVGWLVLRATALLCATQIGVCDQALRLTADYATTREQFGRPIATFQAVTQRLADQYIHAQGVRLTASAATWRLAVGLDAREQVATAKWFASDWAHEVAHATQHIHGGIGVSTDYPLHRYTLWNKHIETSLGAGTQQLRSLGALLAGAT